MSGPNQLSITNIINVSVSSTPTGLSAFNMSNLALFTSDVAGSTFGSGAYKIYLNPSEVAADFGTSSGTYAQALAVFSQTPNILAGNGYLVIIPYLPSETLSAAIVRTVPLVQYYGVMSSAIESQTDLLAAAATIQANPLLVGFFVGNVAGDIAPGGKLDLLRTGSYSQARGLYYGDSTAQNALNMQAAYAGRALSTNFAGSLTTQTIALKTLNTIQPDPTITQTQLNQAVTAGADTYPSFQGVAKVASSNANGGWFDEIYNLAWLVGSLQVSGFNYLAQTSTKVPQTEQGMSGLKAAYAAVCEQALTNQYIAAGTWQSPNTFGVQSDFLANIAQRGYYIYSTPIALQAQTARVARQAPLVQIAVKEAGAIQQSSVIINVNP